MVVIIEMFLQRRCIVSLSTCRWERGDCHDTAEAKTWPTDHKNRKDDCSEAALRPRPLRGRRHLHGHHCQQSGERLVSHNSILFPARVHWARVVWLRADGWISLKFRPLLFVRICWAVTSDKVSLVLIELFKEKLQSESDVIFFGEETNAQSHPGLTHDLLQRLQFALKHFCTPSVHITCSALRFHTYF